MDDPDDPHTRPLLPRTLHHRELVALDVLAAAGYTLVLLAGAFAGEPAPPAWLVLLVIAGIGPPVAFRRRWPWPVFALVLAASVAALALDVIREPFVAAAFALYLAALRTPRRRREPTIVIAVLSTLGVLGVLVAGPAPGAGTLAGPVLVGCVLMGAAWTVGRAVRERRSYAARHTAALADRAATEERLRIARELHDVVSHTLSMIGVKAGIARHVADTRPQEAQDALQVIETTSRDALTEMRRMLGLLRAGPTDGDQTRPLPDTLRELAEQATRGGVPVELTITGADRIPDDVARSAHRIVQEAVTNVIRHAGPARCQVQVTGGEQGVRVVVTDNGTGSTTGGHATSGPAGPGRPGYGLIGIRERAARHGGTFTAGPDPAGGFAVTAWLPYQPATVEVA